MKNDDSEPLAQYANARQDWVDYMAEMRQARQTWQLVAFISIAIAVLSVIGLVAMSMQHEVVPWVVELDSTQQVVRTYPAEPMLPPSMQHTRATLGRWVQTWRGVSPDAWVIDENTAFLFSIVQKKSAAESRLHAWMRENNPYTRARTETVSVEIIAITKRGGESWQIEWRETIYTRSGTERESNRYTSTVRVIYGQPKQETILLNPGGLFVVDIDWQEVWVDA